MERRRPEGARMFGDPARMFEENGGDGECDEGKGIEGLKEGTAGFRFV